VVSQQAISWREPYPPPWRRTEVPTPVVHLSDDTPTSAHPVKYILAPLQRSSIHPIDLTKPSSARGGSWRYFSHISSAAQQYGGPPTNDFNAYGGGVGAAGYPFHEQAEPVVGRVVPRSDQLKREWDHFHHFSMHPTPLPNHTITTYILTFSLINRSNNWQTRHQSSRSLLTLPPHPPSPFTPGYHPFPPPRLPSPPRPLHLPLEPRQPTVHLRRAPRHPYFLPRDYRCAPPPRSKDRRRCL